MPNSSKKRTERLSFERGRIVAQLTYQHAGTHRDVIGAPYGMAPSDRQTLVDPYRTALADLERAHEREELGFLHLPDEDPESLETWAADKREGPWTDVLVVGIGGSSLGTRALRDAARDVDLADDGLTLHVSEHVDPERLTSQLDALPLESTLVVVVTKSGTTVETMSQFALVYDRLVGEVGRERADDHCVAVTSPDSGGLRRLAERRDFKTFAIPSNVGGRFSVLSPVGLVPMALAGYPIRELLEGARLARQQAFEPSPPDSALFRAVADAYLLYEQGIDEFVMMAYGSRLETLVDWFRQLWAESLGKAQNRDGEPVHEGITPVKAVGTVDQHSQVQLYMEGPPDRYVIFLEQRTFEASPTVPNDALLPDGLDHLRARSFAHLVEAELEGTAQALREAGRPTSRWRFREVTPRSVGGFVLSWELITAIMGEWLDIDAFNQPGVERGKQIAHRRLTREDVEPDRDDRPDLSYPFVPDAPSPDTADS